MCASFRSKISGFQYCSHFQGIPITMCTTMYSDVRCGTITSPNYPNNYKRRRKPCTLRMFTENPARKIQLTFTDVELAGRDKIEVRTVELETTKYD